jgi:hypothetical protein
MNNKPELDLTIEYEVNVDLWKHDDDLCQQRNHTFLTMNTMVAAGSSTKLEGLLPSLIAGFWLLILLTSLLIISTGWTGS